jgi:hypothetical protein
VIGLNPLVERPPFPYDTILDEQPLMLVPGQDGLLVGHKLGDLEEDPQVLDGLGSRGIPFAYVITARAADRLVRRDGTIDLLHSAPTIRDALYRAAGMRGTVQWIDPDGVTRDVIVRDVQAHQTSLAVPAWQITLTLALHDPIGG